jgi:hypothetical protein
MEAEDTQSPKSRQDARDDLIELLKREGMS